MKMVILLMVSFQSKMDMYNVMEEFIILLLVIQQKENFKTILKDNCGGDLFIVGKMDNKGNLADFCYNNTNSIKNYTKSS